MTTSTSAPARVDVGKARCSRTSATIGAFDPATMSRRCGNWWRQGWSARASQPASRRRLVYSSAAGGRIARTVTNVNSEDARTSWFRCMPVMFSAAAKSA